MSLAGALDEAKPKPPRILTIDIETSPAIGYVWGMFDQNISASQLIEPTRVLCFAGKWLGSNTVHYFSEFHDGKTAMVEAAWNMMNEADVIVGYNHARFDIPHLHREFLLAGMSPPSPHQDVDLLRVMRSRFKLMSNKLGYVTQALGMDTKLETGGQQLWNDVLKGDPKAWKKFKQYNKQDVVITEHLYSLLAGSGWIKTLPHAGMWTGSLAGCYACGSHTLIPAGLVHTRTAAFPQAVCACGAWNRILKNGQTRSA